MDRFPAPGGQVLFSLQLSMKALLELGNFLLQEARSSFPTDVLVYSASLRAGKDCTTNVRHCISSFEPFRYFSAADRTLVGTETSHETRFYNEVNITVIRREIKTNTITSDNFDFGTQIFKVQYF